MCSPIKKAPSVRSRPLVIPRSRRKDNIKLDYKLIDSEGVDWIDLAQDRDKLRAAVKMSVKFWTT